MKENLLIPGRVRDLGGFSVRRVLPYAKKRILGPFVFFDHMGPMQVDHTHALDVRPHPHIGLATVTYLFEGRGYHRDSLGSAQLISPGDINWMTAGRGIAHSERTPEGERSGGHVIHGIQIWVALPREHEEIAPSFFHHPEHTLPSLALSPRSQVKLLVGEYGAEKSPVAALSRTLYLDLHARERDTLQLSPEEEEIGVYLVSGELRVNGENVPEATLLVPADHKNLRLEMSAGSRALVFGGARFPEERHIWWNFVSSSKERIRRAATDWKDGKFARVPGETEFIPLPDEPI